MTVTASPRVQARRGIKSTVDQEHEEEFSDGPLPRDRGAAALGTETFGYLATFTNAAQRDAGVLAGEQLGFPARPALAVASGS